MNSPVFGFDVSMWDGTIAVGAPGYGQDPTGQTGDFRNGPGAVFIFRLEDTDGDGAADDWSRVQKVLPGDYGYPNGRGPNCFGYSVSLVENSLMVGAPGSQISISLRDDWTDSVHFFERTSLGGNFVNEQILYNPAPERSQVFGLDVALAQSVYGFAVSSGVRPSALVQSFRHVGGVWEIANGVGSAQIIGNSKPVMALSTRYLVLGTPINANNFGGVEAFEWNLATRALQPLLPPRPTVFITSDAEANDRVGGALAFDRGTLVFNAVDHDGNGIDRQVVDDYNFNTFQRTQRLSIVGPPAAGEGFGGTTAQFADGTLFIGASANGHCGRVGGSVAVYSRSGDPARGLIYTFAANLVPDQTDDLPAGAEFGAALATDTAAGGNVEHVLIGAPGDDDQGDDTGAVFIFRRNPVGLRFEQVGKVLPPGGRGSRFGAAIAWHGDRLVIGAPGAPNPNSGATGNAYFYAVAPGVALTLLGSADPSTGVEGGAAVAVSDASAAIGSPGGFGVVALYERSGLSWIPQTTLAIFPFSTPDRFGAAMAFENDQLVVGAPEAPAPNGGSGATYFFEHGPTGWVRRGGPLSAPASDPVRRFGAALSRGGGLTLIGSDDVSRSGRAFLALSEGTNDTLVETVRPASGTPGDGFGAAVSIRDRVLAVGSPRDDTLAVDQGGATVFTAQVRWIVPDCARRALIRDDVIAALGPPIASATSDSSNLYATAVTTNGEWAAVGRPYFSVTYFAPPNPNPLVDGQAGAVHLFQRTGSRTWVLRQTFTGNPGRFERFGVAVAMDNEFLIVGSETARNASNAQVGAATVFRRIGDVWERDGAIEGDSAAGALGRSVAIDGGLAVIGDPVGFGAGPLAIRPGNARIAARVPNVTQPGDNWRLVQRVFPTVSNEQNGANFGRSVAIAGGRIAVGYPQRTNTGISTIGQVLVFEFDQSSGLWSPSFIVPPMSPSFSGVFGESIALDQDRLYIATRNGTLTPTGLPGHVRVLRFDGSALREDQTIENPLNSVSNFASSIALGGNTLLVGANGFSRIADPSSLIGGVVVYRRDGPRWGIERTIVLPAPPPPASRSSSVGTYLAASGGVVWIGDQLADFGCPATLPDCNTGRAYAIDLRCSPSCVADVDDGNGRGVRDAGVGIEDLLYYVELFGQGDLRADVDDGNGTGTLDDGVEIGDLLYYLEHFFAGC
jgi:hypothetical protein